MKYLKEEFVSCLQPVYCMGLNAAKALKAFGDNTDQKV